MGNNWTTGRGRSRRSNLSRAWIWRELERWLLSRTVRDWERRLRANGFPVDQLAICSVVIERQWPSQIRTRKQAWLEQREKSKWHETEENYTDETCKQQREFNRLWKRIWFDYEVVCHAGLTYELPPTMSNYRPLAEAWNWQWMNVRRTSYPPSYSDRFRQD